LIFWPEVPVLFCIKRFRRLLYLLPQAVVMLPDGIFGAGAAGEKTQEKQTQSETAEPKRQFPEGFFVAAIGAIFPENTFIVLVATLGANRPEVMVTHRF
jgi:hypothetical protein